MQNPALLDRRILQLQELAAANPPSGQREGEFTLGAILAVAASLLCLFVLVPVIAYVIFRRRSRSIAGVG